MVKDQRGKYGRYRAEIRVDQNGSWGNMNDALVAAGHAVYQEYGSVRIIPALETLV